MYRSVLRKFRKRGAKRSRDIDPEDIFLDSANLPGFKSTHLEGRIERPMEARTFLFIKVIVLLFIALLGARLWALEIKDGSMYARVSENNRLSHTVIFANRGVVYDRNGVELAANSIKEEEGDFAE
ncbi:MAG: hypothetical protein Q8O98_01400, partial [bacterium]|nr:hypothetical protein [bacterium]